MLGVCNTPLRVDLGLGQQEIIVEVSTPVNLLLSHLSFNLFDREENVLLVEVAGTVWWCLWYTSSLSSSVLFPQQLLFHCWYSVHSVLKMLPLFLHKPKDGCLSSS